MGRLMKKKQASRALLQRVDLYLVLLRRIRHQQDEQTIHDFRVASRNLLALFPLFPPQARPKRWKRQVNRRLHNLNRLRDLHALKGRMPNASIALDMDIALALGGLASSDDKKRLRRRLQRELRHSGRIAARFIRKHPEEFMRMLQAEWFRIHVSLFKRLCEADGKQPRSLHKLRVAYKSFRYLVSYMYDAGELLLLDQKQVKYWQDMLGEIQDSQFTLAWLAEHRQSGKAFARHISGQSIRQGQGFIRRRRRFRRFIEGLVW